MADAEIVGKDIPVTKSVPASSSGKATEPGSNEGTHPPGQPEVPLPKPGPGPASMASAAASDSGVLSGAPHRD